MIFSRVAQTPILENQKLLNMLNRLGPKPFVVQQKLVSELMICFTKLLRILIADRKHHPLCIMELRLFPWDLSQVVSNRKLRVVVAVVHEEIESLYFFQGESCVGGCVGIISRIFGSSQFLGFFSAITWLFLSSLLTDVNRIVMSTNPTKIFHFKKKGYFQNKNFKKGFFFENSLLCFFQFSFGNGSFVFFSTNEKKTAK